MKKRIIVLLVLVALIAAGAAAFHYYAPATPVWRALGVVGLSLSLLSVAILIKTMAGPARTPPGKHGRVVLKDGRDYRVDVDERHVALVDLTSGKTRSLPWNEITSVFVVAIDTFPVGGISYVLHRGDEVLEVPLGATGNETLLAKMQEKLDGFDNEALIEGMAMLQGFKRLWPAEPAAEAARG